MEQQDILLPEEQTCQLAVLVTVSMAKLTLVAPHPAMLVAQCLITANTVAKKVHTWVSLLTEEVMLSLVSTVGK